MHALNEQLALLAREWLGRKDVLGFENERYKQNY
jgi:hypothetical protein